jgi:Cu(I)/Ag(I) efflux system protein CusF
MKKIILVVALFLGLLGIGHDAFAQMTGKGEGEIRKIDKDTNKITMKHGPIEGMDMPGMTMVFQVKDPSLLDRLQPGDRVQASVLKENGVFYIVTATKTN